MPIPSADKELEQQAIDFVAELCVHQDADQAVRRAMELLLAVRLDERRKALELALAITREQEEHIDGLIAKLDAEVKGGG